MDAEDANGAGRTIWSLLKRDLTKCEERGFAEGRGYGDDVDGVGGRDLCSPDLFEYEGAGSCAA